MAKETLTAKVSPKTLERLEKYADNEGISKSEATDRLLTEQLDIIDSKTQVIVTDGGPVQEGLDRNHEQMNRIEDRLEKHAIGFVLAVLSLLSLVLFEPLGLLLLGILALLGVGRVVQESGVLQ